MAAAAGVASETVVVALGRVAHTLTTLSFLDRRGRKPHRRKVWVLTRAIEAVLFNVKPGDRSTGAWQAHLQACSMGDSVLTAERARVTDETITEEELQAAFEAMRPLVEPEQRMKIRKVSLVPITVAVSALTEFGRNDATSAILKALNKVPKRWALEIEQEANRANHEEDLLVTMELQQMDEDNDEHLECSFAHELVSDFTPYAVVEEDTQKSVQKLQTISPTLAKQLTEFKSFRTSDLNRFRVGSKVAAITHAGELEALLRFLGFCQTTLEIREPSMKILRQHDVGALVQQYAEDCQRRELRWSSITNYLSAIISAAAFANVDNDAPPPLDQLTNLRHQTEKNAREQTMYRKRSDQWIDWEDVQRTRIAAISTYNAAPPAMQPAILRDLLVILFHSVTPPDRVGVIRRLCLNLSLCRDGADWVIDTTRQKHKTSKFYGPTRTTVSKLIAPYIDLYVKQHLTWEFSASNQQYLFHPTHDTSRCIVSGQWTTVVKNAFKKYSPAKVAPPPKLLRSSFITYLRSSDAAPEVLKSAATTMRHLIDTQASDVYDKETHDRMARAAFEWCEEVANTFSSGTAGTSGVSAAPPQPVPLAGEIVCTRSDETAPTGKVFYTAPVEWRDEMYAGCVISAHAAVLETRLEFTAPAEHAFRLTLGLPSTLTVASFALTDLKMTSGAKHASADAAPAPLPAAPVPEAVVVVAPPASAAVAAAAPSARRPPKPRPILVAASGTIAAVHKPSKKAAAGKLSFVATIPWDDERFYHKAKMAIYVPPIARVIPATVPQKPRDGSLSVTLTLPSSIGADSFQLGEVTITSGPKPAPPPQPAAATAPPRAATAPLPVPPAVAAVAPAAVAAPPTRPLASTTAIRLPVGPVPVQTVAVTARMPAGSMLGPLPSQPAAVAAAAALATAPEPPVVAASPLGCNKRARGAPSLPAPRGPAPAPPAADATATEGGMANDTAPATDEPWGCEHCTLRNDAWRQKCGACQRRRRRETPRQGTERVAAADETPQWLCTRCAAATPIETAQYCSNPACQLSLSVHGIWQSGARERGQRTRQ